MASGPVPLYHNPSTSNDVENNATTSGEGWYNMPLQSDDALQTNAHNVTMNPFGPASTQSEPQRLRPSLKAFLPIVSSDSQIRTSVGSRGLACLMAALSFATISLQTVSADSPNAAATQSAWDAREVASDDKASQQMDVEISHGGKLIARHHASLEGTPGLYPLLSPSGLPLTRDYPMQEKGKYEKDDHHHHRSVWFTHGIVNDLDFWLDKPTPHTGYVVQTSMTKSQTQNGVVITTENDWNHPEGKRVLSDQRRWTFSQSHGDTVIDLDVRLKATDGDVVFGDTKEGTLGVRVAGTMKVDSKLGGTGQNAEGLKDGEAWGKVSSWVDYSGPIMQSDSDDPSTWPNAGITIFYHPENQLQECYWHVRTYGLFAANPFGRHHFGQPEYDGVKIADGEHMDLHFRIVLHDGGFDREKSEQHFADYADTQPSF
ncbi:DUF6807 domain-containing protein [Rhodopirellula halodulae]|uniref:DUF6807 domain-containing protein n=1 Tax=Rhodopirellula halodulae TaxID=2894198 RepID=UPI001E367088|nr:PmoA family protein [Rhodopirellula sp. JC737]MCC9657731.1 PmoA family protein [Rhodopirellula sp. JC737]